MNTFKKTILGAALAVASSGAFATNVGGVVWDASTTVFTMQVSMFEGVLPEAGQIIKGFGRVNEFNGSNNPDTYCPGCELTYTFNYRLTQIDIKNFSYSPYVPFPGLNQMEDFKSVWNGVTGPGSAAINTFTPNGTLFLPTSTAPSASTAKVVLDELDLRFYVDATPDFVGAAPTYDQASDGELFIKFKNNGLVYGEQNGSGNAYLDAVDGLALANFNTNTLNGLTHVPSLSLLFGGVVGADAYFQSTGSGNTGIGGPDYPVSGGVVIEGKTVDVPEPASLVLLGMGLLGFGASRMRKQA
jgi:hypothetical protein